MEIPSQIQSRKSRIGYWIFYQLYTFDTGKNKVVARPLSFLPEMGIIYLMLKELEIYNPPKEVVIPVIALGITLCWIVGKVYMHFRLDEVENIVGAERNPYAKEVHANVAKTKHNL